MKQYFHQKISIKTQTHMSQHMRLWDLSHRRPAQAQASLRIHAVSPESSLFAHMKYGSRRRVRPKIRHLAPTGWLRMRVWRMSLRRTKSTIISWAGSISSKRGMFRFIFCAGQSRYFSKGRVQCPIISIVKNRKNWVLRFAQVSRNWKHTAETWWSYCRDAVI